MGGGILSSPSRVGRGREPSGLGPWVGALLATTQLSARRVGESGRRLVACGSSWRSPPIIVGGGARRTVGSSLAYAL
jgi:hypothetical protein